MKVILKVEENYVGKINDYTNLPNNVSDLPRGVIDRISSIVHNKGLIEVNKFVVDYVNMDSTNTLMGRVCKKNAREIHRLIDNYYSKKGEKANVLSWH